MEDNEDRTVLMRRDKPVPQLTPINISFVLGDGQIRTMQFNREFVIGRGSSCDVLIDDTTISREHVRVYVQDSKWYFEDLNSTNGVYINNQRLPNAQLEENCTLFLGEGGPRVDLNYAIAQTSNNTDSLSNAADTTAAVQKPSEHRSLQDIARHYFESDNNEEAGEYTMLVRQAFKRVKKKQSRRYIAAIGVVAFLLVSSVSVVIYQRIQLSQLKDLTVSVFYNMKELEIRLAQIENERIEQSTEQQSATQQMRSQISEMQARYDAFLDKLGVVEDDLHEVDQLILKTARIFGECEIDMPPKFADEVKNYIKKWKTTNRFRRAIEMANSKGYAQIVKTAMLEHYLPPQFFYLALQESSFKRETVGPATRFGIAKGIWQFIPTTARRYDLQTGPLLELPRFDPRDERFDFKKATHAAARYLRDIYKTEAQASGLLVVASYNLGENRVRDLIRQMPQNPRERNFWTLLKKYKIPKETYDYVFYIFSAAVIGENPRLFGFEFDNPLL